MTFCNHFLENAVWKNEKVDLNILSTFIEAFRKTMPLVKVNQTNFSLVVFWEIAAIQLQF